jgi:putative lipoic acid-binding regulatory protein
MATPDAASLIEYPSRFPIKVMGANAPGFEPAMIAIALRFDPGFEPRTLQRRSSRGGKYLGLTLDINATSREQLDAIYRCLSSHPLVKVVL